MSTLQITAGDCSRKMTKAAAEKQTEQNTREPTNGMSVTSLFQALTQTTTPPMFMAKTDSGATSIRRIPRRSTLTRCGRTIQTAATMSTADRPQKTYILETLESSQN